MSDDESKDIEPSLRGVRLQIEVAATHLQTDNASCGFWALFFAWTCLLGIDIRHPAIQDLSSDDIKELLKDIWNGYMSDRGGLPTEVLQEWFADFDAPVQWDALPDLVRRTCLRCPSVAVYI